MELYAYAALRQVANREACQFVDIDSYIVFRRDLSAIRASWAMLEFVLGLDLPEDVVYHPAVRNLDILAGDLVSWCNVRYILLVTLAIPSWLITSTDFVRICTLSTTSKLGARPLILSPLRSTNLTLTSRVQSITLGTASS